MSTVKEDTKERDLLSDDEGQPEDIENAENFVLADFMNLGWNTLPSRTHAFAPVFRKLRTQGAVMRQARSAASNRMTVALPDGRPVEDTLMLGSNNYLGLADEPEVVERVIQAARDYGVGCGGPPLLNGTTPLHAELEAKLAAWKGCESALIFSSGYSANVGWSTALLSNEDVLIYDAQSHASLYDGIKMGRFQSFSFRHNDIEHLRRRLMRVRWGQPYTNIIVCVEGVYSMDGDVASVDQIAKVCKKYDAYLAIDDAHGLGVLGATGKGVTEHFGLEGEVDIVMGTFSKTLAVTGGFVCGSSDLVDYLRIFSRSYMFSASLPPTVIAAALAGMDFIEAHPERVQKLRENVERMLSGLRSLGFPVESDSAIIPIFVPEGINIRHVVTRLHERRVFVNCVEYPAVPRNRQRLRMSLMATLSADDIDYAVEQIAEVADQFGFLPGSERAAK